MPTAEGVIDLMKRTQSALKVEGQIRLYKITSNSHEVMQTFPQEDLGNELNTLEIGKDFLPVQRSLKLAWDLHTDSFLFDKPDFDKLFTRRGLLSTLNSIFDLIGFLAPFTVNGKILLREATPTGADWDDHLPLYSLGGMGTMAKFPRSSKRPQDPTYVPSGIFVSFK